MRTVRVAEDTYLAVAAAAEQRGLSVEEIVEELLRGPRPRERESEPYGPPAAGHRPYREMVGLGRTCHGRFGSLDEATTCVRAERDSWDH